MSSSSRTAKASRLSSTETSQTTIVLTGTNLSIDLSYTTLVGNNPSANGNVIAWWPSTTLAIPYSQAPAGTFPIPGTSNQGSVAIPALISTNSYVVGYSVGPSLTEPNGQTWANICTLGLIPDASSTAPFSYSTPDVPSLLATIQSESLSVGYSLPTGNTPQSNDAWIGVYEGTPDIYDGPPQFFQPITSNLDTGGAVVFNNIPLDRGLTYTVVLFMSGYSQQATSLTLGTAAATYQFTIP